MKNTLQVKIQTSIKTTGDLMLDLTIFREILGLQAFTLEF